ncbi:TIGR03620 family F420-dependent LLM class oxidoreductase [Actinokineospora auranticolor]|uniref:Putative F420-dependent oxidoreductase n=1 Tax=Actinokineospora auranticolor TaxID=155976 RepID=A0A2S6GYX1_9PSEU|nr:TIGR03620 family F420-dependent LLM class oxidoreductase [Actinokineospora auranticolor]PPK70435.1 putative F420-dependent oxidoreductase [Actinokineospora auranticolor]
MLPSLGRVGVWVAGIDLRPVSESAAAAAELEGLGFSALWLSEGLLRDPFLESANLLRATESLVVGTGIAVIWGRHPRLVRNQVRSLTESHPDRFVLGLGSSHARVVEGALGLRYSRPLTALREHLDGLDEPDPILPLVGLPETRPRAPRVLAALGPKALALARDRADGAITYFVTPEHTAQAREILGPDRRLVVEQAVVVGVPDAAERARTHVGTYLATAPYHDSLRRLGFTDADLADGGSARLVDAIVATSGSAVADRVDAHLRAGADQVCLQALPADPRTLPLDQWRELAELR